MPFGPATLSTPTQPASWYGALSANNCTNLLAQAASGLTGDVQLTEVYQGAGYACRAVVGNSATDWAAASAALTAAHGVTTPDCLDKEVYRLLTQLLAAHDADPATPVRIRPATRATACPYEVTGIEPDTGAAGDTVVIQGSYLWAATDVYFGDLPAQIVEPQMGGEPLEVTVPAAKHSGPVRVRVLSSYDGQGPDIRPVAAISPQDFTYSSTPSASASASTSASASASASPNPGGSAATGSGVSGAATGSGAGDPGGRDSARRPRE